MPLSIPRKIELGLNVFVVLLLLLMVANLAGLSVVTENPFANAVSSYIPEYFAFDFLARVVLHRKEYLFSSAGLIDFVSFAPEIVLRLFGINFNLGVIRVVRVVRLVSIFLAPFRANSILNTFYRVIPLASLAFLVKGVLLSFESASWWPGAKDFTLPMTILGFAVAAVLGAKLNVSIGRYYGLEETISKIVATARLLDDKEALSQSIKTWMGELRDALQSDKKQTDINAAATSLRLSLDRLLSDAQSAGANAPALAAFSQSSEYLLHRMTTTTPKSYNRFLEIVLTTYAFSFVAAIQGPIGLIFAPLGILIIGGLYELISDIDDSMNYTPSSLIRLRLESLEHYIHIDK